MMTHINRINGVSNPEREWQSFSYFVVLVLIYSSHFVCIHRHYYSPVSTCEY